MSFPCSAFNCLAGNEKSSTTKMRPKNIKELRCTREGKGQGSTQEMGGEGKEVLVITLKAQNGVRKYALIIPERRRRAEEDRRMEDAS